jgi:hypothetical protein
VKDGLAADHVQFEEAVDRYHAVMQILGERFVYFCIPDGVPSTVAG